MDPMSAITAGLSAVTSGLNMLSGIFGAVDSFAGLATKFFDALSSMIKEPQQAEAQQVADESSQGLSQSQGQYVSSTVVSIFGGAPLAA